MGDSTFFNFWNETGNYRGVRNNLLLKKYHSSYATLCIRGKYRPTAFFPLSARLWSHRSRGGIIAEGGDSSAPTLPVRGATDSYSRLTLGVRRTD